MSNPRDLYAVLGIKRNASAHTVRRAYRKKAMENHPDRNPGDPGAESRYVEIVAAHETLSDPVRRKRYDETGEVGSGPRGGESAELVNLILPLLMTAVSNAGNAGTVETRDLAAVVRSGLADQLSNIRRSLNNLKKSRDVMERALARFVATDGGDCLPADILRAQIVAIAEPIGRAEADADAVSRAADYMKRVKYRTEPGSGKFSVSANSVSLIGLLESSK